MKDLDKSNAHVSSQECGHFMWMTPCGRYEHCPMEHAESTLQQWPTINDTFINLPQHRLDIQLDLVSPARGNKPIKAEYLRHLVRERRFPAEADEMIADVAHEWEHLVSAAVGLPCGLPSVIGHANGFA